MSLSVEIANQIKSGLRGEIKTIPLLHSRMSEAVKIRNGIYTLVGGDTGTGKSAYVDQAYLINPYLYSLKHSQDFDFYGFLFSFERNPRYRLTKWISNYLCANHKILVDTETLLGYNGVMELNKNQGKKIEDALSWISKLEKHIMVLDNPRNPTGIYKLLREWFADKGDIVNVVSKDPRTGKKYFTKKFVPHDPRMIVVVVIDHIGLVTTEKSDGIMMSKKQNIDKLSEYIRILRDTFGVFVVCVSQFNRSIKDPKRNIKGIELYPNLGDFKDSGNPTEDADVVKGLFSPGDYAIEEHLRYKVHSLLSSEGGSRMRSVHLLKNSYGKSGIHYPMHFIGESGSFRELPKNAHSLSQDQLIILRDIPGFSRIRVAA